MYSNGEASGPEEASSPTEGFVHQASIYGSDEEFMGVALPFVEEAIASGEPTLVAVPERNLENLRSAIDGAPPGVTLTSNRRWYETSAQTREKFGRWVLEQLDRDGDRRVRLMGEPPWPIGHGAQVRDWARYESVLNLAFAGYPADFICPYDARALPDEVIAHARSTHPQIAGPNGASDSDAYEDPTEFCSRLDAEIEHPSGKPTVEVTFDVGDLPVIRRLIATSAMATGLALPRVEEMVLAINEIATNALVHGRPPATLRIWRRGDELVCEVSDAGDGIKDVLAGQLAPAPGGVGGRGLWLTRLLCDAVEVTNGSGCTVSVHAATPDVTLDT